MRHAPQIQAANRPWQNESIRVIEPQPKRARDANPKGIPSLSPGLQGTSYPGRTSEGEFNPNGVVACRVDMRCNPVGVGRFPIGLPRVARSSQPWADGGHNPVGIENACKVQSKIRALQTLARSLTAVARTARSVWSASGLPALFGFEAVKTLYERSHTNS